MQNLELNSWLPLWPIRGVKVAWRSPLWIIRRFALFVALKAAGMASYVMQRLVAGVRATQVAWKLEATTASRVRCEKERGTVMVSALFNAGALMSRTNMYVTNLRGI